MTEPSAPTLEGYTFAGWYTDEACTTQWNFATGVVDRNLELYAKWNEIEVPEPVIDTAELQKLVDEMDRVDLEKYEKDAAYDAFVAALQNAKAVLTDPESEQAVAEAKAALTEAYANLKLIEMPEPALITKAALQMNLSAKVNKLWVASPDAHGGALQELAFTQENGVVSFTLPSLKYWTMIVAE